MCDDRAHLMLADRHIAEGAERTARLREMIALRQLAGRNTARAERLLDQFMRFSVQHRQQVIDTIIAGRVHKAKCGLDKIIAEITFQG